MEKIVDTQGKQLAAFASMLEQQNKLLLLLQTQVKDQDQQVKTGPTLNHSRLSFSAQ